MRDAAAKGTALDGESGGGKIIIVNLVNEYLFGESKEYWWRACRTYGSK
jgi:hypothetical protein